MATTLSGTVSSISKFLQQSTQDLSIVYTGYPTRDYERTFSTTDVTKIVFKNYTVTSTPTSVDLTSLTDPFGTSVNFATLKHIQVCNNDGTNSLTVGGGTNGVFSALPVLVGQNTMTANGSCVNLTTNITIDSTHKILTLTASAGSISVDVFLVGT